MALRQTGILLLTKKQPYGDDRVTSVCVWEEKKQRRWKGHAATQIDGPGRMRSIGRML